MGGGADGELELPRILWSASGQEIRRGGGGGQGNRRGGGDGVLDPDEMEVERALGVEQDPRGGNPKPRTITKWLESEIQRRRRGKNRLSLKEGGSALPSRERRSK